MAKICAAVIVSLQICGKLLQDICCRYQGIFPASITNNHFNLEGFKINRSGVTRVAPRNLS